MDQLSDTIEKIWNGKNKEICYENEYRNVYNIVIWNQDLDSIHETVIKISKPFICTHFLIKKDFEIRLKFVGDIILYAEQTGRLRERKSIMLCKV